MDAKRDKLDRRRSTKLTVPATFDGQFITLIVYRTMPSRGIICDSRYLSFARLLKA